MRKDLSNDSRQDKEEEGQLGGPLNRKSPNATTPFNNPSSRI